MAVTTDGKCSFCGEPTSMLHVCPGMAIAKVTRETYEQPSLFGSPVTRFTRCKRCGEAYTSSSDHECRAMYAGPSNEQVIHEMRDLTSRFHEAMSCQFAIMGSQISELDDRFDKLRDVLVELLTVIKDKL